MVQTELEKDLEDGLKKALPSILRIYRVSGMGWRVTTSAWFWLKGGQGGNELNSTGPLPPPM